MHFRIVVFAAATVLLPSPAIAKGDAVTTGAQPDWAVVSDPLPVPDNARGIAFFRSQDSEVHLDKDGQSNFLSFRVKVLQSNALQLGNVAITWNPAASAPIVHWLRVYRDGAARDILKETKFEVLRREDNLEQSMLSGILTAVLRVPDLRVGDELEFAYTTRQQDQTMGSDSFGILYLADSPPPGRFRLRLSWDDGQKPGVLLSPGLTPMAHDEANAVDIVADMPGPADPPKDAPPRYNWQRIAEYSDFASWQAVSSRFAPLFAKAATLKKDSPIKHEAAKIAAAHPDAMGRAAAALTLVEQQVRYIYVGLNNGNLTPVSADETWQRRYGDCKGKTALLLALLHELAVPAEAVLANNSDGDDGLDTRLPSPGMFDHVLVRAQIDGQTYWLDGTLPMVVPPTLDPVIPYRWVLPLNPVGKGLDKVAWKPATEPDNLALYEMDARDGFTKPAHLTVTTIEHGLAGLQEYARFSSVTDAQLENAIRQQYEGSTAWNTVEKVTWRYDTAHQASVFTVTGTGPLDWDDDKDGARSISLPGGGFSPPGRRQRGSDQDQTAPFYTKPEFDCRVTTLRLPADTAAKDWSYNTSFVNLMYGKVYWRGFERRHDAIRMIRSARTISPEILPDAAASDNARLGNFDNSMAWVYYIPNSTDQTSSGQTAPATYEGDWVADASACLRPNKIKG